MTACLPFSFYVDKDENNKTKIYIKYFEDCARFYSEEKKTFIKDKVDRKFAVEKINDTNPFDYIQNFGMKYLASKCPHAHFVYMKKIIHDAIRFLRYCASILMTFLSKCAILLKSA
jgi:hypothetical protein